MQSEEYNLSIENRDRKEHNAGKIRQKVVRQKVVRQEVVRQKKGIKGGRYYEERDKISKIN